MARKPTRPDPSDVFLNCPFDAGYAPLFEVLVFTVYACGFRPRCALEEADSGDVRVDKIIRLIRESRYAIHDISRVELDPANKLPRFNMPFELGLDLGCRKFGGSAYAAKKLLVLDSDSYRYQKCLSDISGQDIRSHDARPERILQVVRDWLRTTSRRLVPGDDFIRDQYKAFAEALPIICDQHRIDRAALNYLDFAQIVEEWLRQSVEPESGATK